MDEILIVAVSCLEFAASLHCGVKVTGLVINKPQ